MIRFERYPEENWNHSITPHTCTLKAFESYIGWSFPARCRTVIIPSTVVFLLAPNTKGNQKGKRNGVWQWRPSPWTLLQC